MLEEDVNDTQLVETASAITSDLGQAEPLSDRHAQRCRTHLVVRDHWYKQRESQSLTGKHIISYQQLSVANISISTIHGFACSSWRVQGLSGCLGGEDFLKPVLIEIDNCAEMSSGDGCWDEFITEPSDRSLSEHFSWFGFLNGVIWVFAFRYYKLRLIFGKLWSGLIFLFIVLPYPVFYHSCKECLMTVIGSFSHQLNTNAVECPLRHFLRFPAHALSSSLTVIVCFLCVCVSDCQIFAPAVLWVVYWRVKAGREMDREWRWPYAKSM